MQHLTTLVSRIRSCNPKPALEFDRVITQPVIPDVIMRPQHGGGWLVELNNEVLPRVLVNNHYYTHISRAVRKREEKQYITECFQSANWLVKSLHQRATTILKVATEIIRQQQEFFIYGVQGLKPLVLRDIADAISMHESTVSRVTSQKFVATPRGIYELKYFFTHAIGASNGGDSHSAESVRHRIKKMIDAEMPQAVLSDDALADALQKEGIDIARRTVAKYREAMRIPSSMQRRREKSGIHARHI
jgi:RNA polymerase sigma-54 factor